MERNTIKVSPETHEYLRKLRKKDETYDAVIQRLRRHVEELRVDAKGFTNSPEFIAWSTARDKHD